MTRNKLVRKLEMKKLTRRNSQQTIDGERKGIIIGGISTYLSKFCLQCWEVWR